jgi:hypothetical protein
LGLKKLEDLRCKRETMARKLEFSKFNLEDSERRAKKAKDLLEDAGLEMWKADADIGVVRRELLELQRHRDVVAHQILNLKRGGGIVCCPKLTIHLDLPEEVLGSFDLEPCSFCNRWYTSFDVVMASCKHFYHPGAFVL